jgi:hypothetical protein
MADEVKIVECPRDAWQGLPAQIPAYLKTDYLKALIGVGFKHIDAASFVSPKAVPQMADSEEVLKDLDPPDDVEIIAIVVKEQSGRSIPMRFALSDFLIPSRQLFYKRTSIRRSKIRSTNWKRSSRRVKPAGSTPSSIFPWPSAIRMATLGTPAKWWMRLTCLSHTE